MTLRRWHVTLSLVLATGLIGCSSDIPQDISSTNETPTGTTTNAQVANNTGDVIVTPTEKEPFPSPGETVTSFLQAVRAGNQDVASALLTEKAIAETKKLDIVVAPPGSAQVQYQVGEVEYHAVAAGAAPTEAHVLSNWSEPTEGGAVNFQVVWILKKAPDGWRISGMAVRPEGTEEAMRVNFEDGKLLAESMGEGETQPTSQPVGPNGTNQAVNAPPASQQTPVAQPLQPRTLQTQPAANTATRPSNVQLR